MNLFNLIWSSVAHQRLCYICYIFMHGQFIYFSNCNYNDKHYDRINIIQLVTRHQEHSSSYVFDDSQECALLKLSYLGVHSIYPSCRNFKHEHIFDYATLLGLKFPTG